MVDMAHIAGLVAAGLHPSPVPHADFVTSTTHKTLRGPRGGLILCKEDVREGDRQARLPGHPGRAAHARHRRQGGGASARRSQPSFSAYQEQVVANAAGPGRHARRAEGFRIVSGGTDNHLMLVDVVAPRRHGQGRPRRRSTHAGITVNKNTIPFDTQLARWSPAASASARRP